jgi:adenine-specific DNA methylase
MFDALPPYLGGKRWLVGEIFKHVPPPSEAPVFIDAFLGGGAVSLFAKARGYEVLCNDIALRSVIVGRALIDNSRVTISPEDINRLFVKNPNATTGFVEHRYCPDTFTRKQARFLDGALANARQMEGEMHWLMLLLIVKYAYRMRPHGNFGAKSIIHQLEEGRWDEMNPNYVRQALNIRINSHPKRNCEAIAREINKGVFSNARHNRTFKLDVFDFLGRVEGNVIFLDPPYAATSSYEAALKPLDDILRGEERPVERSAFSSREVMGLIERLFDSSKHIPHWVMSYGNAVVTLEELAALMKRFRSRVEAREIRYAHCLGLARKDTRERNREFLLVGRE